ncbi:hypothetical protein GCM10011576_47210 [Micromonospora parathelypteridis]|nr:hypothetical protein GCM10011576_47210 [Micromonospora parathelypteridis]
MRCPDPVDAGVERVAAEFRGKVGEGRPPGGVVVGNGQVTLRLESVGVAEVDLATDGRRSEAHSGVPRESSEALSQEARAGVGRLGSGEDGEVAGRPQAYRCIRGTGRGRVKQQKAGRDDGGCGRRECGQ